MKKLIKIVVMSMLIFGSITSLNAQDKPYKASIGVIVGNMEGGSFKMFCTPHLVFGADFGYKRNALSSYNLYRQYIGVELFATIELNPYLAYQGDIKKFEAGGLYWFAGGGLSGGFVLGGIYGWQNSSIHSGAKFGTNAIGGVEFTFSKIPLTLQGDFRPGVGCANGKNYGNEEFHLNMFFDWTIGISARYTFK